MPAPIIYGVVVVGTAVGSAAMKYYIQTDDDWEDPNEDWNVLTGNESLVEVTEAYAQEKMSEGWTFIQMAGSEIAGAIRDIDWDAIGGAVGKAASEVIKATTEVTSGIAKEIVPDLIESVERGYEVIREKMDGKEASMIGAFTVGFLVIMTFVYIFYEVRRGK